MENLPEFDGDNTSEILNEAFPATEASPPLEEDIEVSSPPSEFSTTGRMKNESRCRQTFGEDGSMRREACVKRRVKKDGRDEEDTEAKEDKGSRAKDMIYSTILVSVAVVVVVGVVIAKIALARKVLRGA